MADPAQIEPLRDFNRFYTSRLGMTRERLHSTTHPLAEARVLYELGAHGDARDDARCASALDDRRRPAEPAAQAPRGPAA